MKKELWTKMRSTAMCIRDTYKQALRGLFVTGTSVIHRNFSEGGHPKGYRVSVVPQGTPSLKRRRIKEKVG